MQANGNGNAEKLMVANELTSVGDSDSMTGQRKAVRSILDQFVDSDLDISTSGISKWDDVPALPLCSTGFYQRLAYFLAMDYIIEPGRKNSGHHLSELSARNYLGLAINAAQAKFKATGGPEVVQFFTCVVRGSQSAEAGWLKKLKNKMQRTVVQRSMKAGDVLDQSESTPSPPT